MQTTTRYRELVKPISIVAWVSVPRSQKFVNRPLSVDYTRPHIMGQLFLRKELRPLFSGVHTQYFADYFCPEQVLGLY